MTVNEFLERLASPKFPGPASGSAEATVAAISAALFEMSCRITAVKNKEVIDLFESIEEIKAIRKHCMSLATEDMNIFGEVAGAAKAKEEFPEEYEAVMKSATDTLVSIVKDCESIITQIEKFVDSCCIKLLGDLTGSAHMAESAAASAKEGVEENLEFLDDAAYKEEVLNLVRMSYKNISETKDRIVKAVTH